MLPCVRSRVVSDGLSLALLLEHVDRVPVGMVALVVWRRLVYRVGVVEIRAAPPRFTI